MLYLPPIHPIGRSYRKGMNGSLAAGPDDVGSPWAIGSEEGGHKSLHPLLGTLADFKQLVEKAREHEIEIALDIAYQCSPDHPYVKEHPQWFRKRPDGTIQYAENPPKKYQDIYPIDFETEDWRALWDELKSVLLFWCQHGVRIFRVDNPHTKAFRFWEWVIAEVKKDYPETIFLAEAFTRPKVMYRLAKLGFSSVVHVFHLAQHQGGANPVFHRADTNRCRRILPSQPVAEHSRYPAGVSAGGRAPGLHVAPDPCRHVRRQLRDLWPCVRALRQRAA